jgi:hypothetical protein
VIEIPMAHYFGVVAGGTLAGAVFGFGFKAYLDSWLVDRRARRQAAEWTPGDDDWLDSWGIRP